MKGLRVRLRLAWRVLRGRPLIYRAAFVGSWHVEAGRDIMVWETGSKQRGEVGAGVDFGPSPILSGGQSPGVYVFDVPEVPDAD